MHVSMYIRSRYLEAQLYTSILPDPLRHLGKAAHGLETPL